MAEFDAFAQEVAQEEASRKRQLTEATSLGAATTFEPADPSALQMPEGLPRPAPGSAILSPAKPTEFDGFAEDVAREENAKVSAGLELAARHDPESYARARAIADRDGIPVDFALENLSGLQKRETVSKMRTALEQNPGLREWFKQRDNGAMLRLDEIDRLSGLPWLFEASGTKFSEGWRQVQLSEIGAAILAGRATPEQIAEGERLNAVPARDFDTGGFVAGALPAFAEMAPSLLAAGVAGFKGGVSGGAVGATVGGIGGAAAGGVGALPGAAAGLGIGFTAGAGTGAALKTYELEAGAAYWEFSAIRDEAGNPLDPDAIRLAASFVGAVNAGLEVTSLATMAKQFPGVREALAGFQKDALKEALKRPTVRAMFTNAAKSVATTYGTEVTTEVLQEAMTILGGEIAKAASDGTFQSPDAGAVAQRLMDTATQTAQAMTVMGPLLAVPGIGRDYAAARRASRTVEVFSQINEEAKAHDLKSRNPAANKEAVEAAMQGSGVDRIYVPVERLNELFQSVNVDPRDLKDFTGFQDSYTEALTTGGDVEIRFSDFHTKLAGTPFGDALVPHIRLTPEDMTAAEAQAFNEAWTETRLKLLEEDMAEVKAEQARTAPGEAVFQDVRERLVAAGRSADVATQYATVWQAFFATLAEKTGGDALQLYKDRGVEIRFAFPEQLSYQSTDDLDLLLDDLRAGRDVAVDREKRKALGPSLATFLRSKGGLQDAGGELRARDVSGTLLAKGDKGLNLDDATLAAWEAGYFPDFAEERPSIDNLLAALDRELAGEGVYAGGRTPDSVDLSTEYLARLETMGRTLDELGLSVQSLSNEAIRQELEAITNQDAEQGALFQFGGVQGAVRLDGAEVPALQEAARLEEEGRAPAEIFEATGWFRGVDGNWRFEIADTDAVVNTEIFKDGRYGGRLGDVLDHPTLFKAYPALADLTVALEIGPGAAGEFNGEARAITASGPDEATLRSILLHEVAHAIQTTEGFAPGGNLYMGEVYDGERFDAAKAELDDLVRRWEGADAANDEAALRDLERQIGEAHRSLLGAAQLEYYRRIAGEVEARNVQERDRLRQEGREPGAPEATQDVPAGQQIIIARTETHGHAMQAVGARPATETPEFKAWFGSSDVVDHSGRPHIVYHGSPTAGAIEAFKRRGGGGVAGWFAENRALSDRYATKQGGGVVSAYLSIENPLDLRGLDMKSEVTLDELFAHAGVNVDDATIERALDGLPRDKKYRAWQWLNGDHGTLIGALERLGYDGIVQEEGTGERASVTWAPFRPEQIKSTENRGTFDPADPRILYQRKTDLGGPRADKRGSIQFGTGRTIINLFEQADLSTFLHETGHFFLEVTRDMALQDGAPQALVEEWDRIREWLGIEGNDIPVDAHEQFARGFEAYLFEGKAPSEGLRGAFARFRAWLTFIYRKVTALNVTVTPEIKAVFDRMLATEEEINAAAQAREFRGWMDAARVGMEEAEFRAYRELADKAVEQAKSDFEAKLLADVKRETTREWNENKKAVRAEVVAEFSRMPVYQVTHYLRTGQPLGEDVTVPGGRMVLDRAYLVDRYGESVLTRLPRGVPPIYADKATSQRKDVAIVHPDILAEAFGYESGDALIQDMLSAPSLSRAITEEVALRMRDRYGDLLNDQARRADEAVAAMHNDARGQFIETEMRVLARRGDVQNPMPRQVAARMARDIIAAKKVADATRVGLYARQEARAARDAEEAILAGDFAKAAEHKRRQLFSHYLALEARRAREEVESATRYLNRFGNRKRPASVDPDYLDQIEGLLERYDLKPGTSLRTIEKRKRLAEFIAEKEATGEAIAIPQHLRDEAAMVSYKDLTVDDLRAVVDSVKNLEHLGRLKNKLILNRKALDFQNVKDELTAAAQANTERRKDIKGFNPSRWEALNLRVLSAGATMARIEQVIEWLDGGDINGPWRRYLWAPIAEAQGKEAALRDKTLAPLLAVWDSFPKGHLAESYVIRSLGPDEDGRPRSLKKSEIVALALNLGTESNRQRLMAGERLRKGGGLDSEAKLDEALSHLTKADWDAIQVVWDQINSLWPEASALEKRLTGLEPVKVEARAVVTPHGTYRGGYYPLVYDNAQAVDVSARLMSKDDLTMDPQFARLGREAGYLKTRVEEYSEPLSTSLDVITRHIEKVIHDITHWEAVKEVNKTLMDPEIATVIRDQLGTAFNDDFKKWAKRIWYGDDLGADPNGFQHFLARLRTNAGIFALAYRWTTVVTQFAGFGPSAARVGVRPLAAAMRRYWAAGPSWGERRNAVEAFVFSKSSEMKNRAGTIDRDIRLGLAKLEGKSGAVAEAQRWGFMGIAVADRWVSVPTWLAGYNEHLAKFPSDEAGAVEAGDRAVRLSQGAGGTKDVASIQADPRFQAVTMFYTPFSVLFNNLWDLGRRVGKIRRDGGTAADYYDVFARALFFVVVPAIMADLMAGRGPDEEDKEEKGQGAAYAAWAAKKVALYPFATIPILRDGATMLDLGFETNPSPAGRMVGAGFKFAKEAGKGTEANPRVLAKNAADFAGMIAGLPIGQVTTSLNNAARHAEQGDLRWYDFLISRR